MNIYKRVFILLLVFIYLFAFISCQKNKKTKSNEKNTTSIEAIQDESIPDDIKKLIQDEGVDQEIRDILKLAVKIDKKKSVFEKIEAELEDKKIDKEESVYLSLIASYDENKLPKRFKKDAEDKDNYELNAELQWIYNNYETMNKEDKKKFRPFYLSPDEPDSFYYPLKKEDSIFSLDKLFPTVHAEGEVWNREVFSTSQHEGAAFIYYDASSNLTDFEKQLNKDQANEVKKTIEKAWPMFKSLLGIEPTDQIKIYLTNTTTGPYGSAIWQDSNRGAIMYIRNNLSGNILKSTTAHELFHVFQFYLGLTFFDEDKELLWLMEATAVWSEHFVYPEFNTEHEYLSDFFPKLHLDRIITNKKHEYGSYMYFLFLGQYLNDNSHIKTILKKARNEKIRDVVMNYTPKYDEIYPEFALYNWNKEPWQAYQDVPSFPPTSPSGDSMDEIYIMGQLETGFAYQLDKGAINYIIHYFGEDDDSIRTIKFEFKTPLSDKKLSRQALIKVSDVWTYEDWSELTEKELCRRKPDENAEAVILILANADLTTKKSMAYEIDTTQDCEFKNVGYMEINHKVSVINKINGTITQISKDTVEYYDDPYVSGDAYVITERNLTYNEFVSGTVKEPITQTVFTQTDSGSGTLSEKYTKEDSVKRFVLDKDRKGGKLFINPNTNNTEWITFISNLNGIESTEKGASKLDTQFIELRESEILEDRIKGRRTISMMAPNDTEIIFEYIIPPKK